MKSVVFLVIGFLCAVVVQGDPCQDQLSISSISADERFTDVGKVLLSFRSYYYNDGKRIVGAAEVPAEKIKGLLERGVRYVTREPDEQVVLFVFCDNKDIARRKLCGVAYSELELTDVHQEIGPGSESEIAITYQKIGASLWLFERLERTPIFDSLPEPETPERKPSGGQDATPGSRNVAQ